MTEYTAEYALATPPLPVSDMWQLRWRNDPAGRAIADRHYNRQSVGASGFVPPGRCLVLLGIDATALWVTSWPFAEFVKHEWPGAWINSTFRREAAPGDPLKASEMIREAVAITRWKRPAPELGIVTFIDPAETEQVKVRGVPVIGFSYLKAGFEHVGFTKGGLWAFQMTPDAMPEPVAPQLVQPGLWEATA